MEESAGLQEVPPIGNQELFVPNPEQELRWDSDIATMESMKQVAAESGFSFVLGDGYAVEAHCGGIITRPHGDIDGKLYGNTDATNLSREIANALQVEVTQWSMLEPKDSAKIEFREVAPYKEFEARRRLELQIINSAPGENTQRKTLIDSQGIAHEFDVDDINLLTAIKVRIINDRLDISDEEKATHKRYLKQQDIDEVKRLMAQSDFKREDTIRRLGRTLARKRGLDEVAGVALAEEQIQKAISLKL